MSKRAEELAKDIGKSMTVQVRIEGTNITRPRPATIPDDVIEHWAALIDAELRKERERCAERARQIVAPLIGLHFTPDRWACIRAAILDDKEAE